MKTLGYLFGVAIWIAALYLLAWLFCPCSYMAVLAQPPKRELKKCFVYLPSIKDVTFRRWCEAQSKRLP